MLVVGICGASGSGKSSFCDYLRQKGYTVADCDAIYRSIIAPPSECLNEIEREFGRCVIDSDNSLNREALRRIVFSDAEKLKRLNAITFSYILREVELLLSTCQENGEAAFFIDAPLLFESGLDGICDYILGITASLEIRRERLRFRDGLSTEQIDARLSKQLNDSVLRSRCTDLLENEGSLNEMYHKADALLRKWGV